MHPPAGDVAETVKKMGSSRLVTGRRRSTPWCGRPPMPCCSRSSWPWRRRRWGPTALTSGCTTSPRQLASPFPLLAAIGARTSTIEIGTAVIDMRYENPLYMAEDTGAADLISGGRLQLGISRGSPEQVVDGFRYFDHVPAEGSTDADMARDHTKGRSSTCSPAGVSRSPTHGRCSPTRPVCCGSSRTPRVCGTGSGGGAGTRATAEWTGEQGLNLMSSTLLTEDTGVPFSPAAGRADLPVP